MMSEFKNDNVRLPSLARQRYRNRLWVISFVLAFSFVYFVIFTPSHSSQNQKHLTYQVGSRSEHLPDGSSTLTTIEDSEEIFLAPPQSQSWADEEEEGINLDAIKSTKAKQPNAAEGLPGKATKERPAKDTDGTVVEKEWKEVDGQWIQIVKKPEDKAAAKADVETTTSTSTATAQTTTTTRVIPNPQGPPNKAPIEDKFEHMKAANVEYPPPDRPYIHLDGFKVCTCLNNATFFTDLPLDLPSGETDLYPGSADEVVKYIDWSAQQILSHPERQKNYHRHSPITAKHETDLPLRGICFTVAQGHFHGSDVWRPFVQKRPAEDWKGKHGGRILRTIDANVALPFLNYDGSQTPEVKTKKHHYNLAYILLVHDNIQNVKALINSISDDTVFIYVHIDLSAPASYQEALRRFANELPNVVIMPTAFSIIWGHISLLWVEIRAFFDLLDLITFDYVINLSGSDYPLKSAKTIHKTLERMPGMNWLWWNDDKEWEIEMRTEHLFQCTIADTKKCEFTFKNQGMEWRPWSGLAELYPKRYKTSQWLILHYSAVQHLRESEAGKLLMIWAENTLIPDEMILATFFGNSPLADRTMRDPKRLMRWRGNPHPESWRYPDKETIETWAKHFLWIRKVDVLEEPELKTLLDGIRDKDEMSEDIIAPYKDGIIPVD